MNGERIRAKSKKTKIFNHENTKAGKREKKEELFDPGGIRNTNAFHRAGRIHKIIRIVRENRLKV